MSSLRDVGGGGTRLKGIIVRGVDILSLPVYCKRKPAQQDAAVVHSCRMRRIRRKDLWVIT